MTFVHGRDAAFPANIHSDFDGVIGGYVGGPNAFHPWEPKDWDRFKNKPKMPIWVPGHGDPQTEVAPMLEALARHGVTPGIHVPIALDMETRTDTDTVRVLGNALHKADYKCITYGSASTVFQLPQFNGYWVAKYTGQPFMFDHMGARGTQYAANLPPGYDVSLWREWVVQGMWR